MGLKLPASWDKDYYYNHYNHYNYYDVYYRSAWVQRPLRIGRQGKGMEKAGRSEHIRKSHWRG